jgi:hypothetical protein
MNSAQPMLGPVIALAGWTGVMWAWMYVTRIPAIIQARMRMDSNAPRGEQMAKLPAKVRWKADNYNHLMELPTVFYAVALALAVMGEASALALGLAWAFVGLRVVHSLQQALVNHIPTRFALFSLSSLVLFALVAVAAARVF